MEYRAWEQSTKEQLNHEAIERRQAMRKEKINQFLTSRHLHAKIEDQTYQNGYMDQEIEKKEEKLEQNGQLDLNQHYRRTKRVSRKKCWNCKSANYLRDHCPYIRCFHCHRLGHVKAHCFMKKIDKLLEVLEKENKKKEKKSTIKKLKKWLKDIENMLIIFL